MPLLPGAPGSVLRTGPAFLTQDAAVCSRLREFLGAQNDVYSQSSLPTALGSRVCSEIRSKIALASRQLDYGDAMRDREGGCPPSASLSVHSACRGRTCQWKERTQPDYLPTNAPFLPPALPPSIHPSIHPSLPPSLPSLPSYVKAMHTMAGWSMTRRTSRT